MVYCRVGLTGWRSHPPMEAAHLEEDLLLAHPLSTCAPAPPSASSCSAAVWFVLRAVRGLVAAASPAAWTARCSHPIKPQIYVSQP